MMHIQHSGAVTAEEQWHILADSQASASDYGLETKRRFKPHRLGQGSSVDLPQMSDQTLTNSMGSFGLLYMAA